MTPTEHARNATHTDAHDGGFCDVEAGGSAPCQETGGKTRAQIEAAAAFRLLPVLVMNNQPLEPRDERTFAIIGAAMEVHRVLGSGFLEVFYRDALTIEFGLRSVPSISEVPCNVDYKGRRLRGHYRMDFVCFDSVVVEVKARFGTGPAEQAQVLNYLAATGHQCGLLLNFGSSRLEHKRFIPTKPRWSPSED